MRAFGTLVATCCGVLVAAFGTSGCALTQKADVVSIHYFAPDDTSPEAAPARAESHKEMRLGRIRAADHLKSEIVFRETPVKFGTYDFDRWTERPDEYVRRAVSRALFEERGITQAVSGISPTLDLELTSFEEVRNGNDRKAKVTLSYALRDDKVVIASSSVTVERPAGKVMHGRDIDSLVEAMGAALHEASEQVATAVASKLTEAAPKATDARAATP